LRKSAQHNLVHRTVIPAKHQFWWGVTVLFIILVTPQ
jgi:hypothetical protein